MANDNKKKNTGFAFACWLLVALILLVFFFVKKDTILSNLQNTDFFGRVFGKTPEFVQNHEQKQQESNGMLHIDVLPEVAPANETMHTDMTPPPVPNAVTDAVPEREVARTEHKPETDTREEKKEASSTAKPETKRDVQTPAPKPTVATTNAKLCFVVIGSDGSVSRKIVTRQLAKSNSPLTDSINALLSGPTAQERAANAMTLIPEGTRLLGASVANGIATLNFSEEFTFNPVGVQGYLAELMQIVYTATSFNTVNSVQFVVEGQREDYLGSEGTWIGSPLSRSSFN
ncbi:MAG: GerMN domain-containing protein [Treponema sp.]|nr:GerMN domain-containing protein [Treponema sp.]